ncbi:MAG: SUMF1/EgtB/PvdO family nonheme iron enzyme, partial [Planctomycetota bacterium]
ITTTLYARRAEAANLTLAERNRELLASERESRIRGLIQELEYFNTLDDDVYTYAKKQTRPAHEWWIEGAELLVEGWSDDSDPDADWYPGLADVRGELAKLRSRARQEGKAELDPKPSAPESFQFDASEDEWWHEQLVQLEAGLLDLQKRLEFARTSVHSPENARLWSEAIAAILSSPRYSGLRLTPQLGLVPIGPDPTTGLWEFAHLASGEPAQRGSDGNLVLLPETGLVLVLLPGGRVPVADSSDQEQDAYLTQIDLDPFFLSKYEMSAGQWERIGGLRRGDAQADGALLPSVNVSWDDCRLALSRVGWLRLSSEAQWEYGCRAGTTPPWWTVAEPEALRAAANLDNAHVLRDGLPHGIGLFRANPFGLHDVLGNVLEWCGDSVDEGVPRRGDGLRDESGAEVSVLRGASSYEVETARVSLTGTAMFRSAPSSIFGLRPARAISP